MRYCRTPLVLSVFVILCTCLAKPSTAAQNIEGKVVLANLDRYDAYLRFGKTRREIKPKKASLRLPRD